MGCLYKLSNCNFLFDRCNMTLGYAPSLPTTPSWSFVMLLWCLYLVLEFGGKARRGRLLCECVP